MTGKEFCLFLCGDVMIGRGIDQILSHHCNPKLYESYITDARKYVFLAESKNGKISYPVASNYIWGDALRIWGYSIPESFRDFAHALIDGAEVDVIFGHSSHHPRPIT